jgi:hypothetical protein
MMSFLSCWLVPHSVWSVARLPKLFGSVERLRRWEGLFQIHLVMRTAETRVPHMFLLICGCVTLKKDSLILFLYAIFYNHLTFTICCHLLYGIAFATKTYKNYGVQKRKTSQSGRACCRLCIHKPRFKSCGNQLCKFFVSWQLSGFVSKWETFQVTPNDYTWLYRKLRQFQWEKLCWILWFLRFQMLFWDNSTYQPLANLTKLSPRSPRPRRSELMLSSFVSVVSPPSLTSHKDAGLVNDQAARGISECAAAHQSCLRNSNAHQSTVQSFERPN